MQCLCRRGFPDTVSAEGFWKYCNGLEAVALAHHVSEDERFFPYLRERLPDQDVDGLNADHEVMHVILGEMQAAREASSLTAMSAALVKMDAVWHAHIQKEEVGFSPEVAAGVMTVPEHIEMAQKAAALSQEHAQPAPLAIPFLFYNLEDDDRAHFMSVMPPQVTQELVPIVWKDIWASMKPFLLD